MILVVAGTQFPFDRLVRAVDRAVETGRISEPVLAQIGASGYPPRNLETVAFLPGDTFREHLARCDAVISHAGVGTILEALALGKPVLVLPRRAAEGEHVNDHQVGTADRFAAAGLVLRARDADHLIELIPQLERFRPRTSPVATGPLVIRVRRFLDALDPGGIRPGSRV